MARLAAPVAEIRTAVRDSLREVAEVQPGALVLVAVSGGADSLALADGAHFVSRELGLRCGAATVDHGLQPESGAQARAVCEWATDRGFDPVEVLPVRVGTLGGPEAAARVARYAALEAAVQRHGAAAVLLGHTREDQAESVLLGLVRGSGARSLAGMAPVRGSYRRPLLAVSRESTRAACAALNLSVWEDPHNTDDTYLRVRARSLLSTLEQTLGPGVVAGLARTAELARADADALDAEAERAAAALRQDREGSTEHSDRGGGLEVAGMQQLPEAVRTRVLRSAAVEAGSPPGLLGQVHVKAMEALVSRWSGQGPVSLPGGVRCRRTRGVLVFDLPHRARVRHAGSRVETVRQGTLPVGGGGESMGLDRSLWYSDDIERVLLSEQQIRERIDELAQDVARDYNGKDLMLVAVLKGAAMFLADFARALPNRVEIDFMAVSSYGSSTSSSGVVRILKDLETAIAGRHVLLVEDIIDSGLTLSWLLKNLASRGPASIDVVALLRKPDAARVQVDVRYVGFDIPNEFVVGYGLDFAQQYRALPFVGTLKPEVYT